MKCLYCGRGDDYTAGQTHEKDCEYMEEEIKELNRRIKIIHSKLNFEEWKEANPTIDANGYIDYLFDGQ